MRAIDLSNSLESHFRWRRDLHVRRDFAAGDPFGLTRIASTCRGFSRVDRPPRRSRGRQR
jgi:arylformamidase